MSRRRHEGNDYRWWLTLVGALWGVFLLGGSWAQEAPPQPKEEVASAPS